jgi:hypothetical protein
MHILLHHAVNKCNTLQTFQLQFFHDASFAEEVQIASSVQMNTEQGSSHSVISSIKLQCQQTCPHMTNLYFPTLTVITNESFYSSRLQTQMSHQNVMLNITQEKIFNPPRLGIEVSNYWQKLDLQLLTYVTILPAFQDGWPFILPPRLDM